GNNTPKLPSKSKFWAAVPSDMSSTDLPAWRAAFAQLTNKTQITAFLTANGHLPRFMHQDLRRPYQPCGKPFWERFDVTPETAYAKKMLMIQYSSGPAWPLATGVCLATEARVRVLALWRSGKSSLEDMNRGSAGFIFTRANMVRTSSHVLISP